VKIGIIGLPNSGKTTVFNALTRNNVMTGSYASPLGEHHVGQVQVPDPRLDALDAMYKPKKKVPAVIEFVDVAGIQKGAGKQGGVSEEMLKFIRDVDALIHVVRVFEDDGVPHPEETVNPARDIATLDTEMILNDLVAVEKRQEKLEKEILRLPKEKRGPLAAEKELLERFHAHLEAEKPLRTFGLTSDDLKVVRGYAFLSLQPMMILLNIGEGQIHEALALAARYAPGEGLPTMAVAGKSEAEISQLSPEDAALFMTDLGITESGLDRVIRTAYDLLGLQSFFTVGEDECRAWTIRRGDNAVAAAGKIHSDLARGFIRAEVVAYDDLMAAGAWEAVKKAGKFRLEGKEYIVKDGDILNIRFNV
jgi:GTP-binding protein YchF